MNEHGHLITRLRAHRLRIVAAFAVGLLVGTTGLATAGALPGSAQEAAHTALGAVGVKVPHGARYKGPECGGATNHGQYVRSQPKGNRAAAAASRCGKPLQGGHDGSESDRSACQGPPPWAGKGKPDKAAKEARRQACGERDDAEETPTAPDGGAANVAPPGPTAEKTDPPAGAPALESTTTTTAESTTTTSATTSTTTTTTTTASGPVEEPTSTTTSGVGLDTTPPTAPAD